MTSTAYLMLLMWLLLHECYSDERVLGIVINVTLKNQNSEN